MDYKRLTKRIIKGCKLDTESERTKAYRKCINYANKHFGRSMRYNQFMKVSAQMLNLAGLAANMAMILTKATGKEKLNLWFTKESGPVLKANKAGLIYLAGVLKNIAKSNFPGEHVHFKYATPPMIGKSYGLEIMLENDKWFVKNNETEENESKPEERKIPKNDINPDNIVAFQINSRLPPMLPITRNKIYRTNSVEQYKDQKVWTLSIRDDTDRMYVFDFVNDEGKKMGIAMDLDDNINDIIFYTKELVEQIL